VQEHPISQSVFLPDFCAIRTVFLVVIIAELLAIVIALSGAGTLSQRLDELALTSLFIQWVALTCAAALCIVRPHLSGLAEPMVAAIAYGLMLAVTWMVSELAWWLVRREPAVLMLSAPAHAGFVLRNLAISAILSAFLLRYFYVQHHWQRRVESESRARFEALQARIRPHFLFNCMNTIASLTRMQPQAAEKAVENLADLFRASLADARTYVRLDDELRLCRQYLDIEGLRLGERLRVEWDIDALPAETLVPALTLQPLIENAVYHGIEPLPDGGVVRVRGRREGDTVHIAIENPLPVAAKGNRHEGNRMAQENVRARLHAFFGEEGRLTVDSGPTRYQVALRLPYRTAPGHM
jgi:two-component system sensor histidine kinase AlgZ